MALLAAFLAALTVAYTAYQLIPIPASYWSGRLNRTLAETEQDCPPPRLAGAAPPDQRPIGQVRPRRPGRGLTQ